MQSSFASSDCDSKKEEGKLRLVTDFRALNKLFSSIPFDITDRQKLIRDIPDDAKYFTVIDIKDAFFQSRYKMRDCEIFLESMSWGNIID